MIGIIIARLEKMRINITGDQEIPDGVIIHGKVPRAPATSCRNCKKLHNCSILQYSLSLIQSLDFAPKMQGTTTEYSDLAFPMPCRGEAWESIASSSIATDPLMQRLGLSDVREPLLRESDPPRNDNLPEKR
jgi:hypothetical protein